MSKKQYVQVDNEDSDVEMLVKDEKKKSKSKKKGPKTIMLPKSLWNGGSILNYSLTISLRSKGPMTSLSVCGTN